MALRADLDTSQDSDYSKAIEVRAEWQHHGNNISRKYTSTVAGDRVITGFRIYYQLQY